MIKTKGLGVGCLRVLSQDSDLNYEVELDVLRSGVNRNKWDFRNVDRYANTFLGTPILCAFPDGQIGDDHNMKQYKDASGNTRYSFLSPTAERIVGAIYDNPSAVRTEERDGETWVVARGKLWRFYNPELVDKIARQGKMEVSAETDISDRREDGDVEVFEAWKGLGVTILGDLVDPAIPGANIKAFAALKERFIQLKAASVNQNPQPGTNNKGVKTLNKKTLMKELASKFEGYRILGVSASGNHVLLLNGEMVPCAYEFQEGDHGVVIPERITPVSLPIIYAFNETDTVEVDAADVLCDATKDACDKAAASAKECEAVKGELEGYKTQLSAMTERENARRMKACEDAVKARLEDAVKHLCADRSLADNVLADVTAGKYMNSVDADGNFIGDQLAVNALLAKVGEAQMKAAQQPSRYAWEGGLVKNSGAGDSLADAIAHISD